MWNRGDKKPVVGVFGFSGCAGDQLAIIHMEDHTVDFCTQADSKFFHMAQSHQEVPKVDVAVVEGSINIRTTYWRGVEVDLNCKSRLTNSTTFINALDGNHSSFF